MNPTSPALELTPIIPEMQMGKWLETYRGVVNAWECDVVEHFTIAYYFDRLADASRTYLEAIGGHTRAASETSEVSRRMHVVFQHELRAGASFHVLSGVVAVGQDSFELGHRVIDSATGESATWARETMTLPSRPGERQKLRGMTVEWTGPAVAGSGPPQPLTAGPLTSRDRVKPWEIDSTGGMSLPGYVHRFSAAAMQALTAIGMTAGYMHEHRRGFSTFELDLRMASAAKVDEAVDVRTAVAHLGKSSLRLAHTMSGRAGRQLAFLSQSGVHLDMDARRSSPLPDDLRAQASKLMAPQP